MKDMIILVEERSAKIVIESLRERFAPDRRVIVVPHDGKNDLEKSFPRRINAWRHPDDALFVVARDNDGAACEELKARMLAAVPAGRRSRTRIRIVIQCLEAWYLGDLQALVEAELITPARRARLMNDAKFRDPDKLGNPEQLLEKIAGHHGKLELARTLGPRLDPKRNRSKSFSIFVETLIAFEGTDN